jgi:hypothetical protein
MGQGIQSVASKLTPLIAHFGGRFLLLIFPLAWLGCSDNRHAERITGNLTSPAKAYPVALRMQSELAPASYLHSVVVTWDRDGQDFNIHKVSYHFASVGGGGLVLSMDNQKHLAYVETNTTSAGGGLDDMLPVDFSGKDVQEILQIALNSGLGNFCAIVPPGKENIMFQLESNDKGTFWHILGVGTDPQGAVVQLRMDIDATSGDVRNRAQNQFTPHKGL